MADDQTVAIIPSKRRLISSSEVVSSSQVVPCDECIRIQLKLIKAEGQIEFLNRKTIKQGEKIKDQSNQIKLLQKDIKKLSNENQLLENKIEQNKNLVSVK